MRRILLLFIFLFLSVNSLLSMKLILYNDRVITGRFIKIEDENIHIYSQEKLVITSLYTVVTIIDDEDSEIPYTDLIDKKKGRLNFNSVKKVIEITTSNIDEASRVFPLCTDYVTIHLKDNSIFNGYVNGNDGLVIMFYEEIYNSNILFLHDDIRTIIQDSEEVTKKYLKATNKIDFSEFETFEIYNQNKNNEIIEKYLKKSNRKSNYFVLGCDIGTSHNINTRNRNYRFDLEPSGYMKEEIVNTKDGYQTGYGFGVQPYKVIKYSGGANCSFIPIYFIFTKRSKSAGFKTNFGINLFFASPSYKGDESTLAGFYAAAGPVFTISDNVDVEILYTVNNGIIRASFIYNQSVSIGFIFKKFFI